MLQPNKLTAALSAGREVFGLINSLPLPLMTEMIGYAGSDFVILDLEHVGVNPQTLENMIRAAGVRRHHCLGAHTMGRAGHHPARTGCGRTGHRGATRVQPGGRPTGSRQHALPPARHARHFGRADHPASGTLPLPAYFERANRELMVVAMIEDREGVEAIEEIVAVPGIDMVLEGAIDLSQSLGVPADAQHPSVQAAIRRIAQACQARGVPFCAIPRAARTGGEHWREQGDARLLARRRPRHGLPGHEAVGVGLSALKLRPRLCACRIRWE
ncbi:HpcH/HpaI aldolase family protein [Cupriavidus basilensis]